MLRIAIVEDDSHDLRRLEEALERFQRDNNEQLAVTVFRDGEEIAASYRAEYDIILMDIEMKQMNGMQAARRIREADEDVIILFITKVSGYALEGYKVDAMDYIIKPISYFSFSETMRKAVRRVKRNAQKAFIVISAGGARTRLDLDRLCYLEVQDHLLIYHTADGNYTASGTIAGAERELKEERFFRCNRCYIVNLDYVDSFEKGILTVHGDMISVSRSRKTEFMEAMNRRIGRG